MAPGSEPASGSVNPKHPTASPTASRGNHSRFMASEAYVKIGYMTRLDCTLTNALSPESAYSSSRQLSPYAL